MITVYAVCTTVGRIRHENQDNFYLNGITKQIPVQDISLEESSDEEDQVFAVCDGMGGEDAGEVAAFLAVEELKKYSKDKFCNEWKYYISSTNDLLCQYQEAHQIQTGTTFAGLYIHENYAQAINVGDSRIYRIRNGKIIQLSKDHTKFQTLVDAGLLKEEDFSRTNTHNYLTQSLGIDSSDMDLDPFSSEMESLQDKDMYLLCSDGLYGVLSADEMLDMIMQKESAAMRCQKLVDLAEKRGSRDNITALLVCISKEEITVELKGTHGEKEFADTDDLSDKSTQDIQQSKEKKSLSGKCWIIGGTAGILLLLIVFCFLYLWRNPKVPHVVGLDKENAKQVLEEKGFLVDVMEDNTDTAEKGIVFVQSEDSSKRIPRGSRICLTVSLGLESVKVPDVTGKTVVEAEAMMTESGFSVNIRTEYSNTVQKDCVISQIPDANSELVIGNTVNITVSKGPNR